MKNFFKCLLLGLANILVSISAVYAIMVGIMAFIDIPNHKGFLVIGMLFVSIILFLIGIYFLYILGYALDNHRKYLKNQERNKEEDKQCQNKTL